MDENNEKRILNLMLAHHALLDVLLTVFQGSLNTDKEKRSVVFKNFQWQLKKHFFVEENIVFDFVKPEFSELSFAVEKLKKEHLKMLELLSKMKEDVDGQAGIYILEFRKILEGHRNTEEQVLYPWMDENLDEIVKRVIVGRINEISFL